MIEVKDLVKSFNGRVVLDHLNFTVEKGQIVGFLGPNGAGKSTTMNIITGYIAATEGSVTVNGYDIYDDPEKVKESIGYLPEQPPLYPDMRVREYLYYVADLKKVKRNEREKMMYEIMKQTKINDVSERLIKYLSKGYKQRVGLAGALMGYPEVLILDEPTVGLDPMQIMDMRQLIKDLSKEHTILLSSHIMQEVSAVCNQIMIINQGKLIVQDTPDKIPSHIKQVNELRLNIKGSKEGVKGILSTIENVDRLEVTAQEDDTVNVLMVTTSEFDIREQVFYSLAKVNYPILEMNLHVPTLEEAFLSLTGEGTKQFGGKIEKDVRKSRRKIKEDKLQKNLDDSKEVK